MTGKKTYRLTDAAFEQFEKLKAREKELVEERAKLLQEHEAKITEARNLTATFLNGVAATLEVPPAFLFIEEYGEFRENRKRSAPTTKKKRPGGPRKPVADRTGQTNRKGGPSP
jgi:hypothetical protein